MTEKLKVIIGCDGDGFPLKEEIREALVNEGYEVKDAGSTKNHQGVYIDAAEAVCKAVQSGEFDRGILVSDTGQAMNITANKFSKIRSALCYNNLTAKLSRADTDANILCTGAMCMRGDEAVQMAKVWLAAEYYQKNLYGLNHIKEFEENRKKA